VSKPLMPSNKPCHSMAASKPVHRDCGHRPGALAAVAAMDKESNFARQSSFDRQQPMQWCTKDFRSLQSPLANERIMALRILLVAREDGRKRLSTEMLCRVVLSDGLVPGL